MSTPENTFIRSVHAKLPSHIHREKQHNAYRGGTPDVFYEHVRMLWVEYKFVVLPKRDHTVIVPGLSALQIDWLGRNHSNGHRPLVIVGSKAGGVIFDTPKTWVNGISCAQFKAALKSRQELAEFISRTIS